MAPRGTARRIADELRASIQDGGSPPGAMLPSETGLAQKYGVARGTVRAALAVLVEEGAVEVVPGIGRRVVGGVGMGPETAYGRIVADLTEQIRLGRLRPGVPLPSESSIMEQYQVSRNTARRAYKVLTESGAVIKQHGVGAFVRPEVDS